MFPATIKKFMLRLCLLPLLLLGWFAPVLFWNGNTDARFTDLNSGTRWYYHPGDLNFENGEPVQGERDWVPFRRDEELHPLEGPGHYWLKFNLHSQQYRDPHLFINNLMHYEIYWDGDRIFESNFEELSPLMLPYYEWNLISLPFGYPAESFLVRVYSPDGSVTSGSVELGNEADFIVRILHQDGDKILFGVIFTLLSIVAALFFFNTRKKWFSYFSLLAFCAAFASLCRTFAIPLFIDAPAMIYWHEIMLPLGAFAFHGFFEHLLGGTGRFRRFIRHSMLVFTGICFAVSLWDAGLYHSLINYVFPFLFLIMIATTLRMLYRMYRGRPSTESAIMIFGYAASTLTTVLSSVLLIYPELRGYLTDRVPFLFPYVRDDELPLFIGLFVFLCCMGTIVLLRENEIHRQVHNYSRELEDQNRRLEQIDKLKDEFLANTSHELRTPLNGIIGITESLLEGVAGPLGELARSNLAMVVSSGKRLSGLINDILDFSKLKHSGVSLFIQGVDLKRTADGVAGILKPIATLKDIRLINSIDESLPLAAADENRVQQILYNLVGNALKFTERGQVEITARVDDDWIYVSVADTGIGIPPDKMDVIFEPFEQVEGSAAREYEGAGLGLAITKKLVELHGGSLGLISVPNRGSTFTFTLRAAEPSLQGVSDAKPASLSHPDQTAVSAPVPLPSNEDQPAPLYAEEAAWSRRETTLLLVDDDPVNLQVLTNFLSTGRYAVLKAANGAEAIRLLEQGARPDLVLTDLMMPRMTGYELCRKIRAWYKPSELPIIVLTAKTQVNDLVEGFEAGANDYLVKPVAKQELLARIGLHLQLSELTHSLERKVRERTEALEEANRLLQSAMKETAEAMAEASVLEERNRISFDIHNIVGHTLTACISQMEAAKMLISRGKTEEAVPKLDTARELVGKGLMEIRESIRMLKLESTNEDLAETMQRLMKETEESADVRIDAEICQLPPLASMQKRTLFHALLEGLTNGIRHGKSQTFTFTLTHGNGRIFFRLANDGLPIAENSMFGFGMSAMQENVRKIGGRLTLESAGGRGSLLSIDIPLDWRAQSRYVENA